MTPLTTPQDFGDLPEPYLFLDASGRMPCAGVWQNGTWRAYRSAGVVPATEGLFGLVDAVLREALLAVADCAGFIFVEGPGSILGIRIAAMALRGWQALPGLAEKPVFAVGSLELAGYLLLREKPEWQDFTLLADSRQGLWNVAVVRGGVVPRDFSEVRSEALATLPGPYFRITQRALGAPPVMCEALPEGLLEKHPAVLTKPGLLRRTDAPDAVNMPGQFVKWTPERHR